MAPAEPTPSPAANKNIPISTFKRTWPLLLFYGCISLFVSADFINLLVISGLLWPGEPFHAVELGGMIALRLWTDGFLALIWGVMVDKPHTNRKRLLSITIAITGIGVLLNGFAPVGSGLESYYRWVGIRMFLAAFMSAGGPAINSLSSDLLPPEKRSQFFGYINITWTIFQVIGMIISAFMFQYGYWRYYYFTNGLLFVVLGFGIFLLIKEPKRGAEEHALKETLSKEKIKYEFQMNKETIRETIFSRTNMLVFFEGFFTAIIFGIIDMALLPYIQSPPNNISPVMTGYMSLIFGVPGGLIGTLYFAKLSDRLGAKNIKNRVKLIVFSMVFGLFCILLIFMVKFPPLTKEQGNDFGYLLQFPVFFLVGFLLFFGRIGFSIYGINQPPLLQAINLPESRGKIASWNQLVEIFSYGSGPLIAGLLMGYYMNNYPQMALILMAIAFPGILMWLLSLLWIEKDEARIKAILTERAAILEEQHS